MKTKIFPILLSCLFVTTAITAQTEFNRIACGSAITIHLKQGDSCSYKTTAGNTNNDANHNKITFEIYNNTLHIEGISKDAEATVTLKELKGLSINGVTKLIMDQPIKGTEMNMEFTGSSYGDLKINAGKLTMEISGASQVILAGKITDASIEVSGASKVNAYSCIFNKCVVEANGASTCLLDSVTENLNVEASGASKIYILKVPEVYVASRSGVGKIYEGVKEMDSTTIIIGDTKVIINDNEVLLETKVKDLENKAKKFTYNMGGGDAGFNWAGFDMGFNGLLNTQGTLKPPAGYNYLDMNNAISLQYNLNLFEKDFKLYHRYIMGMVGAGFSWNNYRFTTSDVLQAGKPTLTAVTDTIHTFNVNKLRVSYFNVPLLIGFNTNPKKSKAFHIATGVVVGIRLNGMVKTTSDVNNENYRKKTFATYNTDDVCYDAMLRMRYKWANLWVSYSLNSLFKKNQGPDIHPVAVGVNLIEF